MDTVSSTSIGMASRISTTSSKLGLSSGSSCECILYGVFEWMSDYSRLIVAVSSNLNNN